MYAKGKLPEPDEIDGIGPLWKPARIERWAEREWCDAALEEATQKLGRYAAAMTDREARIAKNEAIVREINEGIEEAKASRTPEGDAPMMCECGNLDCELLITITVSEYEDVRQNARRFVVVKDHVIPDVERVVAETERFDVVEKVEGTSAEIAEASNPRD